VDRQLEIEFLHQLVEDRHRIRVRVADDDRHAEVAGVFERGAAIGFVVFERDDATA
jgi:hypothetical protein